MRTSHLRVIGAAAALVLLAGCSGAGQSAISQNSGILPQTGVHHQSHVGIPVAVSGALLFKANMHSGVHYPSHFACPASGSLVYMSDFNNSVINIYSLHPISMCGQIGGLVNPQGMFVTGTGDLYVANTGGNDVLAFHRGSTTPFMTMTDTAIQQYPVDVTIQTDGTIVVSNIFSPTGTEQGSIDTFSSNGTFLNNYPMTNDIEGLFVTVTDRGAVYFNDIDSSTGAGVLWVTHCPAGVCGRQTNTGVTFTFPGGITTSSSEDLVGNDQSAFAGDTFELPSTSPVQFSFGSSDDNVGMALNADSTGQNNRWYTADASADALKCFRWNQAGVSTGSCPGAPGNSSGLPIGVATDPNSGT